MKKTLFLIFCLVCLTVGAFESVRDYEFLGMDDHVFVWNNDVVRQGITWDGLKWAWCADLCFASNQADYWQPMTFLSRMLDVQLFGMHAGAHHLMNVFFHLCNVLLIFVIFGRLTRKWTESFVVAALFAVHPMVAEVVGWVTARKDVLSVFFGLGSIWFFACVSQRWGVWRMIMIVLLFLCSLLAKPMMITLPAILWLLSFWPLETIRVQHWWSDTVNFFKQYWLLWLVALCYIPVPFLGQPQAITYAINGPWAKALESYVFYIGKIFYPSELGLYGPVPEEAIPWGYLLAAFVILLLKTCWFVRKPKDYPFLFFGWLWFMITSLPVVVLQWKADRFMYLPKLGLFIIVVWGMSHLIDRFCSKFSWIKYIFFIGLIAGSLLLSRQQIQHWRNDFTVMTRALEQSPLNYAAHNVLSVWHGQRGKLQDAEFHALQAIDINPKRSKPFANLGQIRLEQGRYDEARKLFERALSMNPSDFELMVNLGNAHVYLKNFDQALGLYQQALVQRPDKREIYKNIAIVYNLMGKPQLSQEAIRQAQ